MLFEALAEGVPRFREAGLLDMAYIFTFDEVSENRFDSIRDIHGEIKRLYPGIPLMTTAYDDSYGIDSGLDPYVDIWVPGINVYNQTTPAIAATRERGREIWWYITAGPDEPYPNVRIEDAAVEHRLLMGFMPYRAGSDGFLYWCLNQWTETVNRGPPHQRPRHRHRQVQRRRHHLLPRPGWAGPLDTHEEHAGRAGGLRVPVAARAGRSEGPQRRARGRGRMAEAALAIDDRLGSLTDYSRNPEDLLEARREIAALLAEANR